MDHTHMRTNVLTREYRISQTNMLMKPQRGAAKIAMRFLKVGVHVAHGMLTECYLRLPPKWWALNTKQNGDSRCFEYSTDVLAKELDAAFPATSNLQIARLRLVVWFSG